MVRTKFESKSNVPLAIISFDLSEVKKKTESCKSINIMPTSVQKEIFAEISSKNFRSLAMSPSVKRADTVEIDCDAEKIKINTFMSRPVKTETAVRAFPI